MARTRALQEQPARLVLTMPANLRKGHNGVHPSASGSAAKVEVRLWLLPSSTLVPPILTC
jgi:hypothetical protein